MGDEIKIDFSERCYPGLSPKRIKDDHVSRYAFFQKFASGKTVLDIACGEGYGANILKQGGAKVVYGLDNDNRIIEAAILKYPDINFVVGEATKTPFLDNFFDLVISFETWHHLDDYENFIPEIHRIVKTGGMLVLSVPNERVVYAGRPDKNFFTEFYRVNLNKKKIENYLTGYFKIEKWYGQRFVKKVYLNPLMPVVIKILNIFKVKIAERIDNGLRAGSGPKVLPLTSDNARYLIVVARKI